jgi:hypothetical protein
LLFEDTELKMELDLYVPALRLGIEYQGPQHYHDLYGYAQFRFRRLKDLQKVARCKARGITLVLIPYWWDEKIASFAAELAHARPDLAIPSTLISTGITQLSPATQLIPRQPPIQSLRRHAYPKRRGASSSFPNTSPAT